MGGPARIKTDWAMYKFTLAGWYDERHRRTQPVKNTKPAQVMKKVTFQDL